MKDLFLSKNQIFNIFYLIFILLQFLSSFYIILVELSFCVVSSMNADSKSQIQGWGSFLVNDLFFSRNERFKKSRNTPSPNGWALFLKNYLSFKGQTERNGMNDIKKYAHAQPYSDSLCVVQSMIADSRSQIVCVLCEL